MQLWLVVLQTQTDPCQHRRDRWLASREKMITGVEWRKKPLKLELIKRLRWMEEICKVSRRIGDWTNRWMHARRWRGQVHGWMGLVTGWIDFILGRVVVQIHVLHVDDLNRQWNGWTDGWIDRSMYRLKHMWLTVMMDRWIDTYLDELMIAVQHKDTITEKTRA